MSWKDRIQVMDLTDADRIEATCKSCGHVHYLNRIMLIEAGAARLYLSEVEKQTGCKSRGCWGRVRIALPRRGDTSAFIGGLA